MTNSLQPSLFFEEMSYNLLIPLTKKEVEKLKEYIDLCLNFLEKYQNKTNILVVCSDGKSLSPIILMAFLIKFFKYDFFKAHSSFAMNREVLDQETVLGVLSKSFPNISVSQQEKPKALSERTNLSERNPVESDKNTQKQPIKIATPITKSPTLKQNNFNKMHSIESYRKNVEPELKFEDINCIIPPNENNIGGIFLGNMNAASNPQLLKHFNISAVLTVAEELELDYKKQGYDINHLKIMASDVENFDLSKHFPHCFHFIYHNQNVTNVLIHCYAGVSRSVTVTIAYLMKFYGLNFKKALGLVREKRKQIYPNSGFVNQLKFFETILSWERKKENVVC